MNQNPYTPPASDVDFQVPAARVPIDSRGISFEGLSSADKWRFVWGFFWRSVCVAILSMLGGAIAGGLIGFVAAILAQALGKSLADVMPLIRILGGAAGLFVGFAALWQLIRWCFRANWFGYRLRLVKE